VDSSIKFHDLACWTKSALEEMGALAVFLASEAAASITGVDGGWTAH
jgi:enoyl-[acyl-carrier-protein] reductase (NADH)